MGDPAGIGPEVIAKALADPQIRRLGRFIIYGLNEVFEYAADQAELNPYWFRLPHELATRIETGVVVADFDDLSLGVPLLHQPGHRAGEASMRFLNAAIKSARQDCSKRSSPARSARKAGASPAIAGPDTPRNSPAPSPVAA